MKPPIRCNECGSTTKVVSIYSEWDADVICPSGHLSEISYTRDIEGPFKGLSDEV